MAKNKKKFCVSLGMDNMDTNQHPSIRIYNQANCMMQLPRKKAFICVNTAEYDTISSDADNDALVMPMSTLDDFIHLGFSEEDYERAQHLPIGGVYDFSNGVSMWAYNYHGELAFQYTNFHDNTADYDGIYIMRVI